MRILYAGFGNVAREMTRIFSRPDLYQNLRFQPSVVGIFTGRHGGIADDGGIDAVRVSQNLANFGALAENKSDLSNVSTLEAIQTLDYDVLVELSSLSIEKKGEPAASHIRAALSRGKSVVSANKGPVAFHYRELKALADANGALYLFESAVMDGAPVFNFVQRCMKGARITGFAGILNGTTNFILSYMEQGGTFEDGVKKAQEAGIAEADPSLDVDGWDAAAKVAALANVLMDADITPLDVDRCGISGVTPQDAQAALAENKRLKLICRGWVDNGTIRTKVGVEAVDRDDVFALISHFGSAVRFESDLMHPNVIVQDCPDLLDTAYGVIEDLLTVRAASHSV